MTIPTRARRPSERGTWRGMSDKLKRHYLCDYIEATAGKRVEPSDSFISFALEYIETAYSLNITYKHRKPYELLENLPIEDLL